MAKNIVICCDGTSNEFSTANTNIVRLVQAAKRDFLTQHIYYDPGVGTLPEPGTLTWLLKKGSEIAGLAFGAGLDLKVQEAYSYLMDWWEPGDQVFLFGFSRGAYTVRILAGLLYELGLLAHGGSNMVPYALRLFATAKGDRKLGKTFENSDYWSLRDEFRQTFARPVPGAEDRRFPVHFMGLFDTVASVGWAWDPPKYPYTTHNPAVNIVRHAMSIDERRWFFRPNIVAEMPGQSVEQEWFPGVHADVGGGYADTDGGLWRLSLKWMIDHAQQAGLILDPNAVEAVFNRTPADATPWTDKQHYSLHGIWWLLEFFPKTCRWPGHRWPKLDIGRGRWRNIPTGQRINKAALQRIRGMADYAPSNLTPSFLAKVRELEVLPAWLEYES